MIANKTFSIHLIFMLAHLLANVKRSNLFYILVSFHTESTFGNAIKLFSDCLAAIISFDNAVSHATSQHYRENTIN